MVIGAGIARVSVLLALAVAGPQQEVQPRPGSGVVVAGDTLFMLSESLGPFTAEQRAAAIVARIDSLLRDRTRPLDPVRSAENAGNTDVLVGDLVLMTVTEADAMAAGVARAELAGQYAARIGEALQGINRSTNLLGVVLGILYALLATAVLFAILRLLASVFPRLYRLLRDASGTHIPSLRLQKLELVSADRIVKTLLAAAKIVRVAVTLLLLYFYVPLVLSFFPGTRGLASRLVDYIVNPIAALAGAILGYLPNLFFIAVIVAATYYFLTVMRLLADAVDQGRLVFRGFYPDWALPTYQIARFMVLAFALVVIWPYLPSSDSPAFKGVAAFLALLFSLGSASAVANAVGGIVLIYMRPFQIGDRVQIADTTGDVLAKNLLVTRIRTNKNVEITIPNSVVLGNHIRNYSAAARNVGLIVHTTVTIGYDAPWRDVHAALRGAAAATDGILNSPTPFVLQTALNDFYVSYELNACTDQPNSMAQVYSNLHQNIQDAFNEAGIEIMSPHYAALRDGNVTTIPARYLPPDYEAPSLRVQATTDARSANASQAEPAQPV